MGGSIINGERWISERLEFLRSRLTGDISDDERRTVEAEIETLARERGLTTAGIPVPRFLRRFRRAR